MRICEIKKRIMRLIMTNHYDFKSKNSEQMELFILNNIAEVDLYRRI